ncbi:RHS repeat domain-containing protein [Paenibacillus herberti]|uniref:Teneurin-like YD-shell domain-containing protein n=1 Tax=Paenibacillus herberti TaxID=1619309 RepID=A0A229NU50_9BACL|nr:RHS repeat-associated core domain-containing protein [Paenibacillus herberti]OXM13368.1 hypothetical protein CGZ75_20105 [Paenibacillus herberti]
MDIKTAGEISWDYDYDTNGNLKSVNNNWRSFLYFDDGQVKQEVDRGNTKGYLYYDNNWLKSLTYSAPGSPASTLEYVYTDSGELKTLTKDKQSLITFHYNDTGSLTAADRANGISTAASYEAGKDQLRSYGTYQKDKTPIYEQTFTYDRNGNVETIQSQQGTVRYTYDEKDQLTKEVLADGTEISYTYDKLGNRTSKSILKAGQTTSTTYTFNNKGSQLSAVNGQAYSYDENGNLLSDGKNSYAYDVLDQLTEVKDTSGKVIFKASYDEQGRRIQTVTAKGTTNYFYEGNRVLYETDASNRITVRYIWDEEDNPVAMDGQTYSYHLNGHGDVVRLTDSTGNVVAAYEYDAWGNILQQSGAMAEANPYRYAEYQYDSATGLYYLMSRYYNPNLGRFISTDPAFGLPDHPVTLNDYSYAINNPVTLTDDNGELPFFLVPVFIIFVKVGGKWVAKQVVKKVAKKL